MYKILLLVVFSINLIGSEFKYIDKYLKVKNYEKQFYEVIDEISKSSTNQLDVLENEKELISFIRSETKKNLLDTIKWPKIEASLNEVIYKLYTKDEIDSFIEFSLHTQGKKYLQKENKEEKIFAKIIQDEIKKNDYIFENLQKDVLEKFNKHLKRKKMENLKSLKKEDYYNSFIGECSWPIPKKMQLQAFEDSGHKFFNPNSSMFEDSKKIVFSEKDEFENFYNNKNFSFNLLKTIKNMKLYSVNFLEDENISIFVVNTSKLIITLYQFDEIEIEYMFNYCAKQIEK